MFTESLGSHVIAELGELLSLVINGTVPKLSQMLHVTFLSLLKLNHNMLQTTCFSMTCYLCKVIEGRKKFIVE